MTEQTEYVTVFRSADEDADEQASAVCDLLRDAAFHPELLDDDAPGVVEGSYEVRVPANEAAEAQALVDRNRVEDDVEDVDPSHDLDLVTVARTDGTTAELEATNIHQILEASGIDAVIVGAASMPNLGFEVRVAREDRAKADAVIAEAQAAGPAAALEAEQETEPKV